MSKHTPGVAFLTDGEEIWAPRIVETDYALETFEKATKEGSAGNLSTAVYSLSLVKAAPELLEALRAFDETYVRNLPEDHRDYKIVMRAREVIAKAK